MKNAQKSRGYVTIATGSRHYYELARNLLSSYRRNGGGAWPFAIIAERENEYTAAFDKVVLMPNASHSYLDKLRLFDCLPWEETIFIDADCLVYGRIDDWWAYFEDGAPFSCFGYAYEDLSTKKGWFQYEGMGEYKARISFIPSFSGGVYYVRNEPASAEVFALAREAAARYREYPFAIFKDPADEPLLALGMAVCGCRPVDLAEVGIYVKRREMPADILAPAASWDLRGKLRPVKLVHWGNFGTMKAFYLYEVERMDRASAGMAMDSRYAKLLYGKRGLRYYFLLWHDGVTLLKRIRRRLKLYLKTGRPRSG